MDLEKFFKLAALGAGALLTCAKAIHELEKWMDTREARLRKRGVV
jgi:hypothetical protein